MANPNKLDPAQILDQALELPGEIAPYYSYFDTSKGTPLSFTNMITLYMQGAQEIVGTRTHWDRVGRTPKDDAQRYYIWVPIIIKKPVEGGKKGEVEEIFTGKFRPVYCMYTLSETEGEELPQKETPGWSVDQMLERLGMRMVPFQGIYGGLQGYSRGVELAISPVAGDRLGTIIHEAGHIALGHTLPHHLEAYQTHRGMMEAQAEGTRYLVLNELGVLDDQAASYMRGYVRHWIRDEKMPEQACRQVLTVADRILRAGRVDANFDANPGDLSRQ